MRALELMSHTLYKAVQEAHATTTSTTQSHDIVPHASHVSRVPPTPLRGPPARPPLAAPPHVTRTSIFKNNKKMLPDASPRGRRWHCGSYGDAIEGADPASLKVRIMLRRL